MSRGIGKVQQLCLQVLRDAEGDGLLDSIEIAGKALDKMQISPAEHSSFRRALRQLCEQGLVVDLARAWHNGRRRWIAKERAAEYLAEHLRSWGKQTTDRTVAKWKGWP